MHPGCSHAPDVTWSRGPIFISPVSCSHSPGTPASLPFLCTPSMLWPQGLCRTLAPPRGGGFFSGHPGGSIFVSFSCQLKCGLIRVAFLDQLCGWRCTRPALYPLAPLLKPRRHRLHPPGSLAFWPLGSANNRRHPQEWRWGGEGKPQPLEAWPYSLPLPLAGNVAVALSNQTFFCGNIL